MTTAQTTPDRRLAEAESIIRNYNGIQGAAAASLMSEYDRRGYEIERLQKRIVELDEIQQLRQRVEALEAATGGAR